MILCWKSVSQSPQPFYFYKVGIHGLILQRKYLFVQLYIFFSEQLRILPFPKSIRNALEKLPRNSKQLHLLSVYRCQFIFAYQFVKKYNVKWHRI